MLTEFYWRCAGVDPAEVQHWEPKLRRKYSIFGWFVVMSGFVASISGFLAFLTVFKNIIGSFVFAVFFGLIVFNLYRFVVVNIGYRLGMGKNKREQFISAIPRVFMAFILGFVISKPLELLIFSPAISEKSIEYSEKLYQQQVKLIDIKYTDIVEDQAEIDTLKAELTRKSILVQKISNQLQDSSSVANEQILHQLQKRYLQLQGEYTEALTRSNQQIRELEEQISKRTALKDAELARSKKTVESSFSLLNQLTVLHEYIPNTWLFTTVTVLFYVLPILGKIKFSNDDYALVYLLNKKGEKLGNKLKAKHIQESLADQAEPTIQEEPELQEALETTDVAENKAKKPYKVKPKLALARISMLVVGLIILIGQLNQRNIFTDMLSVMLVLTAVLGWMKIIERELAAIAMVFFTIVGSFAIFLFKTGHPMLGVILGVIILLTFGILLIGSVLPIMRFLYTVGIFLFLVMAIAFTINSMIKGDVINNNGQTDKNLNLDRSDSVQVQVDSATTDLLMSHLRHWQDFHNRDYQGKLEVFEKDYEEAKTYKANYTYGDYTSNGEFWGKLYSYLSKHDGPELEKVTQMFDSIRVAQSLNSMDFAEAVVTCVQDIPYTLISDKSCDKLRDNPKYAKLLEKYGCVEQEYGLQSPTEFMYNLKADCDTRTLLLYTLFSKLGYKVAILNSDKYEHSMFAIALPAHGRYIEHNHLKYYVWETTSKGWQLGSIPPKNNNMDFWEVVLAN